MSFPEEGKEDPLKKRNLRPKMCKLSQRLRKMPLLRRKLNPKESVWMIEEEITEKNLKTLKDLAPDHNRRTKEMRRNGLEANLKRTRKTLQTSL